MPILENVACSIMATIIYDSVKQIIKKFKTEEKPEAYFIDIIKKIKIPDRFISLIETGINEKIINTPAIDDMIYSYTIFQVGLSPEINHGKISLKNEEELLTEIAKKVHQIYIDNNTIINTDLNLIKDYINFIAKAVKNIIFNELDDSIKAEIYFTNSYNAVLFGEVIKEIQNIQKLLKSNCFIVNNEEYYCKIKDQYYAILKSKYSKAHIYLLDKFEFEKFYVAPNLSVSENIIYKGSNNFNLVSVYNTDNSIDSYFTKSLMHDKVSLIKLFQANKLLQNYNDKYNENMWQYIFGKKNIIYVIGGAGYGKTLFLQKLINDYTELDVFKSADYLLIYGELKEFYPNNTNTPISVEQFLQNSIIKSTLLDESVITLDFIRHYLNSGRCIILFDALDEVEKGKREPLHESLTSFLLNQNPNNKICITSRDRGFIPEKDIEVFSIQPLNESQIEKYVDNIIALGKFEESSKDKFLQQTKVLIDKGFLNSFLVLSLLVNIFKSENELPENKLELYQKCFEYIANKRERKIAWDRFDWKTISPLMKDNTFMELADLCFPNNSPVSKSIIIEKLLSVYKTKYNNEVDTENAIEEFLRFCSDRTELFVPAQSDDEFQFFHRSFFEYFYSQYIFVRFNDENEILEKLMAFDVDSEVFELTVAMLKQKAELKYQKLIELIIEKTKEEFDNNRSLLIFNILVLSMQAVDDITYRNNFINILIQYKNIFINFFDLQNNDIIADIVISNNEYVEKICKEYYNDAVLFLFSVIVVKNNEFIFDIIRDGLFIKHFAPKPFYVTIFFKYNDPHKILMSLNNDDIDNIIQNTINYNMFSNKKIKKLKKIIRRYQDTSISESGKE